MRETHITKEVQLLTVKLLLWRAGRERRKGYSRISILLTKTYYLIKSIVDVSNTIFIVLYMFCYMKELKGMLWASQMEKSLKCSSSF